MIAKDLREATRKAAQNGKHKIQTRLSPGEKHHRKRMATVAAVYEIPPQQLSLLRECLRQIEGGREVNIMQANGRPHGANAMRTNTIQA